MKKILLNTPRGGYNGHYNPSRFINTLISSPTQTFQTIITPHRVIRGHKRDIGTEASARAGLRCRCGAAASAAGGPGDAPRRRAALSRAGMPAPTTLATPSPCASRPSWAQAHPAPHSSAPPVCADGMRLRRRARPALRARKSGEQLPRAPALAHASPRAPPTAKPCTRAAPAR